jgi:hypothetical protein
MVGQGVRMWYGLARKQRHGMVRQVMKEGYGWTSNESVMKVCYDWTSNEGVVCWTSNEEVVWLDK